MSTPDAKQDQLAKQTAREELKHETFEIVKMVVWFLILFGILRTFVVEGYEVEGDSMLPTLGDRERILVFKLTHNLGKLSLFSGVQALEAGDIVVFDSSTESNKRYVKRVIAHGPNKRRRKTVDADGRHEGAASRGETVNVQFQNGTVYVNFKRFNEHYLRTKPAACNETDEVELTPNQFYVLGDNRRVSKDSRSFGPIDDAQVIGKAVFRFWPPSKIGPL